MEPVFAAVKVEKSLPKMKIEFYLPGGEFSLSALPRRTVQYAFIFLLKKSQFYREFHDLCHHVILFFATRFFWQINQSLAEMHVVKSV